MYKASRRYLAACISALVFAILLLSVAIIVWSLPPKGSAGLPGIITESKDALPPQSNDRLQSF